MSKNKKFKPSGITIMHIDIGNLPSSKAELYLKKVMKRFKGLKTSLNSEILYFSTRGESRVEYIPIN